jgi:hypothetical protein
VTDRKALLAAVMDALIANLTAPLDEADRLTKRALAMIARAK